MPFEVILSNPGTSAGMPYLGCRDLNEQSNPPCVPVLQHSCVNTADPGRFGDPAIRINTVVRSVAQHRIWSICDDDYGGGLKQLAAMVISQLGSACLPDDRFAGADPARIDCTASDVAIDVDGAITPIPSCAAGTFPCWRLEPKDVCQGYFAVGYGLTIDRNGAAPPPRSYVRAGCLPAM